MPLGLNHFATPTSCLVLPDYGFLTGTPYIRNRRNPMKVKDMVISNRDTLPEFRLQNIFKILGRRNRFR